VYRYRLRGEVRSSNEGRSSSTAISLDEDWGPGGAPSTELVDTWNDNWWAGWAETRLLVPIRVKGDKRPQVLAVLDRSNWTDFSLYAIVDGEIRELFLFSCRGWGPIDWESKGGELVGFTTYDAFEGPPESLKARYPGVGRWQQVRHWSFDRLRHEWVGSRGRWKPYEWGKDWTWPVIEKPSDCPFLYVGTAKNGPVY
jgi:hypothetical protein